MEQINISSKYSTKRIFYKYGKKSVILTLPKVSMRTSGRLDLFITNNVQINTLSP